ncbi:helix-turn-helix domain-containing protein [Streptomyces chryseus]
MTTAQHYPGETDHPAEDPAPQGEDLAAILTRLLEETGKNQKDLAAEAGVPYATLNAWMIRTRGTSRVTPETLRALTEALRKFGARVTPKQIFESAGRQVPGPTDKEREERLLRIYRALPAKSQRALIQSAEAMEAAARVS